MDGEDEEKIGRLDRVEGGGGGHDLGLYLISYYLFPFVLHDVQGSHTLSTAHR